VSLYVALYVALYVPQNGTKPLRSKPLLVKGKEIKKERKRTQPQRLTKRRRAVALLRSFDTQHRRPPIRAKQIA
jgi:hypothetical protein